MAANKKDIELRSEKVRNIVGQVPPVLLRTGITAIAVVIVVALVLAYLIPYPEYRDVRIHLSANPGVLAIQASRPGILLSTHKARVTKGDEICMIGSGSSKEAFKSDITGTVFYNFREGEFIQKGEIAGAIVPDSIGSVYSIIHLPESEMNGLKEGLIVEATVEHSVIPGIVSRIYPIPEINGGSKDPRCKLELLFHPNPLLSEQQASSALLPNKMYPCRILISKQSLLKKIFKF
ncbi:MAG: hypothetical protein H6Q14_2994 [Bacteroidetes bacterium]|nr:hypothetical protein [Bacteroidota bacterium]